MGHFHPRKVIKWTVTVYGSMFPLMFQEIQYYILLAMTKNMSILCFSITFTGFICSASPNVVTTAQQKNQALFQGWWIGIAPRIRKWWKDRWLAQRHSQKSGWIGRGYDKPMPSILSKWYMVVWKSRWWSILWSCFFSHFLFEKSNWIFSANPASLLWASSGLVKLFFFLIG